MTGSVAIIGEAMLELSRDSSGGTHLGYGGDTLNTAVYMARLGVSPDYLTVMGSDPYSERLLTSWRSEGVGVSSVIRHPARLPGLYAIETDEEGERSFHYWRGESAMRDAFALNEWPGVLETAGQADWLYLSGITLSLYSSEHQTQLVKTAEAVRRRGGNVVFDPNFRPRGWPSKQVAIRAFEALAPHISIALPTLEDEQILYDGGSIDAHASRWLAAGANMVVMKSGPDGATIYDASSASEHVAPAETIKPVDTTGAGDSFNAAFMSALIKGQSARNAADAGNRLAGQVIQHRGAVIPKDAMPASDW